MTSSNNDIDDYCRLCAVESQSGVIIYSAEGESLCLEEKIMTCLRIEVSRDDMLPKRICHSCSILLEDLYRFSERAAQVQHTLFFLLGLHLSHSEVENSELCLLDDRVKLESNYIKKEFDEVAAHQVTENKHINRETFDMLLPQNVHTNDKKHNAKVNTQAEEVRLNFNVNVDVTKKRKPILEWEKQSQQPEGCQVKIILPKKMIDDQDNKTKEIDCFIEEIISSENVEEAHSTIKETFYEDLCEKTEASLRKNTEEKKEENEEEKRLLAEWEKHWGLTCDDCQVVFNDGQQYANHCNILHQKILMFTCSFCKICVNNFSTYKLHTLEHISNGRFKCTFCGKKFCTHEMLQIHLSVAHNENNISVCHECGKSFTSHKKLKSHLKNHTRSNLDELECNECGKKLQTKGGLAGHKAVHKLGRHFMCHICGKTFTQKINMQQHVKHHKGERPYSCEICHKSFTEKSHLNRHKSFHTKDRPFQCLTCQKTYKTERCLKVHSRIHGNSRPYVCSYCGKGFLSSTKLKQHHNCHTGERPFACKYCDKTFTNYPNWLKHTRRRHKVDHKTGLKLKNEGEDPETCFTGILRLEDNEKYSDSTIEFVGVPEAEVKEDGGGAEAVQPPQHSAYVRSQALRGKNLQYQMNFLSPAQLMCSETGCDS